MVGSQVDVGEVARVLKFDLLDDANHRDAASPRFTQDNKQRVKTVDDHL